MRGLHQCQYPGCDTVTVQDVTTRGDGSEGCTGSLCAVYYNWRESTIILKWNILFLKNQPLLQVRVLDTTEIIVRGDQLAEFHIHSVCNFMARELLCCPLCFGSCLHFSRPFLPWHWSVVRFGCSAELARRASQAQNGEALLPIRAACPIQSQSWLKWRYFCILGFLTFKKQESQEWRKWLFLFVLISEI